MSNSLSMPWRVCCGLLLLITIANQATAAIDSDSLAHESRPASWKVDAALTDVTFVDRLHGWAVGSHGVLLRTEDGGETWTEAQLATPSFRVPEISLQDKFHGIQAKQQLGIDRSTNATNFSCRFESVCFTDSQNGWAAGGYDLPYMNHSRAVIARTLDGGKSWQSLPHLMLGRIQKIDMSGLSGWSVGPRDPASKSALYFTSDAGNIWNSQKARRMPGLIDAETAENRFVGIDREGQPLNFDIKKSEYSAFISVKDAVRLADLSMKDGKHGYAVGDKGAILKTDNGGLSWQPATDYAALKQFDFRCVDCRSKKVWFAGDPGNILFSLDPNTGELASRVLPAAAAINAIHFVDDDFGWVVGDFGRIYATSDGGENWQLQRSASQGISHVAAMVVCEDASELPLELIAKQAGEDGKLIGVLALGTENSDAIRLAAERIGAVVVSTIDAENEVDRLRRIVRTIRLWKPTLLIGGNQSLSKAMQLANDHSAFPEQMNAGLKPWQPRYLMAADPHGPIQYETSVFLPRIGMQLQDLAIPSRMICGMPIRPNHEGGFFAWQHSPGARSGLKAIQRSPFSLDSFTKRKQTSVPLGSLSSVARVGRKNEQLSWLLRQNINTAADWETCKQRIGQLGLQLRATPGGDYLAAVWLTELADRYVAAGHHERAALALEELARSYPKHCLAPVASTTLARYHASSEFRQRALDLLQKRGAPVKQAAQIPARSDAQIAVEQKTLADGRREYRWNKVDVAAALEEAAALPIKIDIAKELENFDPATVDLSLEVEAEPDPDSSTNDTGGELVMTQADRDAFLRTRLRFAANHFSRIGARDPSLVKRADMLYLQAHIVKQLSGIEQAKLYFENVTKADARSVYATAARSILGEGSTANLTQAIVATERAHLDGLPNDPQWQEAMNRQQMVSLVAKDDDSGASTGQRDIAMVTRDDEYLYLYARCYKSDRFRYRESGKSGEAARQRDADLSRQDRIKFTFDVDRDLVSAWELQIDWRGKVHESCGSDVSWNPQMFVARHVDDRVWSIECAILLEDLQESKASDHWRWTVERSDEAEAIPPSAGFWPIGEVDPGRVLSVR